MLSIRAAKMTKGEEEFTPEDMASDILNGWFYDEYVEHLKRELHAETD